MKTLLCILLILISFNSYSQEYVSHSVVSSVYDLNLKGIYPQAHDTDNYVFVLTNYNILIELVYNPVDRSVIREIWTLYDEKESCIFLETYINNKKNYWIKKNNDIYYNSYYNVYGYIVKDEHGCSLNIMKERKYFDAMILQIKQATKKRKKTADILYGQ